MQAQLRKTSAFFDETPDAAKIEHCAKMANIHDEIAAMPMAYETLIGDMGSALSGGQSSASSWRVRSTASRAFCF